MSQFAKVTVDSATRKITLSAWRKAFHFAPVWRSYAGSLP